MSAPVCFRSRRARSLGSPAPDTDTQAWWLPGFVCSVRNATSFKRIDSGGAEVVELHRCDALVIVRPDDKAIAALSEAGKEQRLRILKSPWGLLRPEAALIPFNVEERHVDAGHAYAHKSVEHFKCLFHVLLLHCKTYAV
jgi:hypothetical protein